MTQKKTISYSFVLTLVLFLISAGFLSALEETIELRIAGDPSKWKSGQNLLVQFSNADQAAVNLESSYQGLELRKGHRGLTELGIRAAEYLGDAQTDLLLHFNKENQKNYHPNWALLGSSATVQLREKKYGDGAALFSSQPEGLRFEARQGSLFEPGTFIGDFSLEFWLFSSIGKEGEEIFYWEGYSRLQGKEIPQKIRVALQDKRLTWTFENFFVQTKNLSNREIGLDIKNISLKGIRSVFPRRWQHHLLRYNARRGLLEYLVDGRPEGVTYATLDGRESASILQAYVGERGKSEVHIGRNLNGFLDELRLSKRWVDSPQLETFDNRPAFVIFNAINFREIGVGSKLLTINADYQRSQQADLLFYYKMGEMAGMVGRDDPDWISFKPGLPITENNSGQFLWLKVEFLPDGSGDQSPGLQSIKIVYRPDPPPPAPGGFVVSPENGALMLRWNKVPSNDIKGYLVYYGTKADQYFGDEADQGPSPIDVGNVTELRLDGLLNGRLYYLRIASYDTSNDPRYGLHLKRSLSKEASARPAR